MADKLILVLDEGTTSTRAMLYTLAGEWIATEQRDITQYYPQPGWVEHDATEIWERTLACAQAMVARAGGAERIAAIGVTNQRETVVAWDKATGQPLGKAIVWQDRRTDEQCQRLRASVVAKDSQSAGDRPRPAWFVRRNYSCPTQRGAAGRCCRFAAAGKTPKPRRAIEYASHGNSRGHAGLPARPSAGGGSHACGFRGGSQPHDLSRH